MQYTVQGVKRLVVSISRSVCHAKKIRVGIDTLELHISQLENNRVRTYAYLAETNAIHSIHNS